MALISGTLGATEASTTLTVTAPLVAVRPLLSVAVAVITYEPGATFTQVAVHGAATAERRKDYIEAAKIIKGKSSCLS